MKTLDHHFLNDLEMFGVENPPSSENIAVYVASTLQDRLQDKDIRVTKVSAWESENACASYIPE